MSYLCPTILAGVFYTCQWGQVYIFTDSVYVKLSFHLFRLLKFSTKMVNLPIPLTLIDFL